MPTVTQIPYIRLHPPFTRRKVALDKVQLPTGGASMDLLQRHGRIAGTREEDATTGSSGKSKYGRFSRILGAPRFNEVHTDLGNRDAEYRDRNYRNKVEVTRDVIRTLAPKQAKYLYANNLAARKNYVRIMSEVLSPFFLGTVKPIWWVTLIPAKFHITYEEALDFNTNRIIGWVDQALHGLDFVAIVEAGCFPIPGTTGSKIMVSFHVHLLAWGWSETEMKTARAKINKQFPPRFSGTKTMKAMRVDPHRANERVFYMCKVPTKEYRYRPGYCRFDRESGEVLSEVSGKRWSSDIRSGHYARMQVVMHDRSIDQLTFARGDGKPLLEQINKRALSAYHREEATRTMRTGGGSRNTDALSRHSKTSGGEMRKSKK